MEEVIGKLSYPRPVEAEILDLTINSVEDILSKLSQPTEGDKSVKEAEKREET